MEELEKIELHGRTVFRRVLKDGEFGGCDDCPEGGRYLMVEENGAIWCWCGECALGG
jgi:hypothetical protein